MRCAGVFAVVSLGLAAAVLPHGALADNLGSEGSQGRVEIRVREVYLYASDPVFNYRGSPYPYPIVGSKTYLEPSAEFFVTPHWSMEIAIASRRTQFLELALRPLTWTAKYNFSLTQRLHPYIGFGWQRTSLTNFLSQGHITIDSSSAGWAAQTGLDVRLSRGWVLNADVRYLGSLEFNRYLGAVCAQCSFGQYRIDPFLFSLGVAYRFANFH
jgi:outer membrane protein W